jgi:LmbE family N-acetylglucosaminyl deacetylase
LKGNRIIYLKPRFCIIALLLGLAPARGQLATAPPPLRPDERYKADVLLVVAHPDDETAVGGFLAKAIFDDHLRLAVVYCNRGGGGGNSAGNEQSVSLGLEREIEARRATAAFGITNIWFLDGRDTPGQDVFLSLENWRHGAVLEEVVRLIRLTRPGVVLTWLPHVDAGENHGDHQASGVIATEAFDLAGNPTVFPAQVVPPREHNDINNITEGLSPWQPQKIYYFSDASHPVVGPGPHFDINAVSPARHVPYYRLAAELHRPHKTQADVSEVAEKAIASGDFTSFRTWLGTFRLLFGKSVVHCSPDGDIMEGVTSLPGPFVPHPGYKPEISRGVTLSLGGAFAFYRSFWHAHGIDNVGPLIAPEITIASGSYFHLPLLIRNDAPDSVEVTLSGDFPAGWNGLEGSARYRLAPGEIRPVQTFLRAPAEGVKSAQKISWTASVGGRIEGTVSIDVTLSEWTLPE